MSCVAKEQNVVNSGSEEVAQEEKRRRKGGGRCAEEFESMGRPLAARRMERAKGTTKAGMAVRDGERKPRPPKDSDSVARDWGSAGRGVD